MYCQAAFLNDPKSSRKRKVFGSTKIEKAYEEAAESFEDCIVRLNSAEYTPVSEDDVDFRVLNFLCRFFKICWYLKKSEGLYKQRWENDVEQLKNSSLEISGKKIEKILNQLLGFAKFLLLKSKILYELNKKKGNPHLSFGGKSKG